LKHRRKKKKKNNNDNNNDIVDANDGNNIITRCGLRGAVGGVWWVAVTAVSALLPRRENRLAGRTVTTLEALEPPCFQARSPARGAVRGDRP